MSLIPNILGWDCAKNALLRSNLDFLCPSVHVVKHQNVDWNKCKSNLVLWVPLHSRASVSHPAVEFLTIFVRLFVHLLQKLHVFWITCVSHWLMTISIDTSLSEVSHLVATQSILCWVSMNCIPSLLRHYFRALKLSYVCHDCCELSQGSCI